ncbi:hypothetical protein [Agromyces sp. GXQ0307]|uniref:hypothetical protein n=1 Tax=Agromyces sp. GXQ0307 TaxID=3377835 RepID=UPI00383A34B8
MNNEIAVALFAGLSAIAAAVLALVGMRSARSEPTAAKELIALDMNLKTSPDGSGNEKLSGRALLLPITPAIARHHGAPEANSQHSSHRHHLRATPAWGSSFALDRDGQARTRPPHQPTR